MAWLHTESYRDDGKLLSAGQPGHHNMLTPQGINTIHKLTPNKIPWRSVLSSASQGTLGSKKKKTKVALSVIILLANKNKRSKNA